VIRATRLPLHPRPLPHEALSSWVDRLAAAYRLERHEFLRSALGADPAPDRGELDRSGGPPGLVAALAGRTGVPPERVRAMTLAAYAPGLIDAAEPSPGLFEDYACRFGWFVLPARRTGVRPKPNDPWMPWRADDLLGAVPRCCPRCLVTDAIPYVRLHWRLAWMASCPLHGETLTPLAPVPSLLRYIQGQEPERAAPELLALDRITLGAVTTGTAMLPRRGGPVPGGVWLGALRALLDELVRPLVWFGRQGRDEVGAAWLRAGKSFNSRHGWLRVTFERLPPEQRSMLLQVAGAAVRRHAARPLQDGPGAMLRAYVTQWNDG
jgi:hypothetical protein